MAKLMLAGFAGFLFGVACTAAVLGLPIPGRYELRMDDGAVIKFDSATGKVWGTKNINDTWHEFPSPERSAQ